MIKFLAITLVLILIVGIGISKLSAQNSYHNLISVETADSMIRSDSSIYVFDIRTKPEFNAGHLIDASHSNFLGFNFLGAFNDIDKDTKIIVYCQTGHRSKFAAKKLANLGFENVYDLEGGFKEWKNIDLPIVEKNNNLKK